MNAPTPLRSLLSLVTLVAFATTPAVYAAGLGQEPFDNPLHGWTFSGSGQGTVTNEAYEISFSEQGSPIPQTASLTADLLSSGGLFTGDYTDAGIQLLAFSFRAVDVVPSVLKFEFTTATGSWFKTFSGMQTGQWYRVSSSLAGKDSGGWSGAAEDFVATGALTNVTQVAFRVSRGGIEAQRYQIADVTSARLPRLYTSNTNRLPHLPPPAVTNALELFNLPVGTPCSLLVAEPGTSLVWSVQETWTPVAGSEVREPLSVPPAAPVSLYRLAFPEMHVLP